MSTYDFVHLALLALGGEVHGKTNLQKKVYFLGELTSSLKRLGYSPHYYGPYSADVSESIDRLVSLGFADRKEISCGSVDSWGTDILRNDYRLTSAGEKLARTKAEREPEIWAKLKKAASQLNEAGKLNYQELSIAAKTYFLLNQKGAPAEFEELSDMAKSFGWKVPERQVRSAAKFLQKLGMVKIKE